MALVHAVAIAALCVGEPPSSDGPDVAMAVQLYEERMAGRISDEQYTRETHGIAAALHFEQLTAEEFDQLGKGYFFDFTHTHDRAAARLEQLARRRDSAGFLAACARVRIMTREEWLLPDAINRVRAMIVHRGWQQAFDPDSVALRALVRHLGRYPGPDLAAHMLPELEQLARALVNDPRPVAARGCEAVVRRISRIPGASFRSPTVVGVCEQARRKALSAAQSDPSLYPYPEARVDAIAFLESDMAKLAFHGRIAPPIDVLWTSDPSVKSLADARGKVVVLEFWAVTCGPCVALIPTMEQLKRDLSGSPVQFISVTGAVQEDLIDARNPSPQQAAVAAEVLTKFMAKRHMSGPVWVGAAGAFDPAYGITGIPSIVILDAQGRVRASGLHPANPNDIRHEVELAGKPLPGEP